MSRRYLPVDQLSSDQAEAVLAAYLRKVKSLPPNTPAGYYDENGVPVVWSSPQAAGLDWQQLVASAAQGGGIPLPVLQAWPGQLPRPGLASHINEEFDGYHWRGPGYTNLPGPTQPGYSGPGAPF